MLVMSKPCYSPGLFSESPGYDHYCGRLVAGLNVLSYEFAVLPPRFDPDSPSMIAGKKLFQDTINYPPNFKSIIPFVFEASTYQLRIMKANVGSQDTHKIFRCKLFTI